VFFFVRGLAQVSLITNRSKSVERLVRSGGSTLAQPITCSVYDETGQSRFFQHLPGYKIADQVN